MSLARRLGQGLSALGPRLPTDRDSILSETLTPPQRAVFELLPAYDQRHLCAVYRALQTEGETDSELRQAALLHDIGKAALGGRVRLIDRVFFVVLQSTSTRLLERATRLPAPRWRLGLALAHHHPRLGAEWAAELGCSPRTCWLIAHHADDPLADDPALRRLIAADRSV